MRNILFIEGGAYTDIKKALEQWIGVSSDTLKSGLIFELYKAGRGKHIIKADNNLPDEQFNYLLNYLKYPEEIDYKINVVGHTSITQPTLFPKNRIGEEILIFIPEDDDEYDNVYWVTKDNHVYKTDFGGKTIESDLSKTYKESEFNSTEYPSPEIFYSKAILKTDIAPEDDNEMDKKIGRRFKIISIIIGVLIPFCLLFYNKPITFININKIISLGVITWFISDYKMLQLNKYFNLSILIAVIIFFYGYQVSHSPPFIYKFVGNLELILSFPLIFLIVQKPLRIGFKLILKREPVIDKPMPSFADLIYFILLLVFFALLSLIVPRTVI